MNENAPRSVCLAILMIASIALPLMQMDPPPDELDEIPTKEEVPNSPCLGFDACMGVDAGGATGHQSYPGYYTIPSGSIMNLSAYADLGTQTQFWGDANYTAASYGTGTDRIDAYSLYIPWGYGLDVLIGWNRTSSGSIPDQLDTKMFWGEPSAYNDPYFTSSGAGAAYEFLSTSGNEASGQIVTWAVWCWASTSCQTQTDYWMNVTLFSSDQGARGDWSEGPTLLELYDGCTFGPPNRNCDGSYTYWTVHTGTFTVSDAAQTASVQYMCDYGPYPPGLCSYSSYVTVTKPDGTMDTFNTMPAGATPVTSATEIAQYTALGTYTVNAYGGNYGYGHISVKVIDITPAFPIYSLTSTTSIPTVSVYGSVGATDTNDYFAIIIPDDAFANVSLEWDQSADLDMRAYSDSSFSTLIYSSLSSTPDEVMDFGSNTDVTIYVKVTFYTPGSTSTASGYKFTLNLLPTVFPPCWFQDDSAAPGTGVYDGSGSGDAANDDSLGAMDITSLVILDDEVTISGMVCSPEDTEDWYLITVPAHQGVWAVLDWTDNESSDYLQLYSYMQYLTYTNPYTVSSSTSSYFHPQGISTNESFYYRNGLSSDTTFWLRVRVGSLVTSVETNYTLSITLYNQSAGWVNPENDAGSGVDAGDSSFSVSSPVVLASVNNTYTGHGHDYLDMYDQYQIYVPPNYGLHVVVSFAAGVDIDVYIKYVSATGSMYTAVSSFNDNPEDLWLRQGTYGGQDMYIILYNDMGAGQYTMDITMVTDDNDPDPADDCGTGVDAHDSVYSTNWADYTWMNNSNQIDANGDADDVGGVCTGWIDSSWDYSDYYNILVPSGKYLSMNVSWAQTGTGTIYTYMYKCQIQTLPCSYPANGAYYVSQQSSNTGSTSGISGLWVTTGGWLRLGIYGSSDMTTYTMDLQFLPLSNLVGGVQDDAGSGLDAGPGAADALHVNNWNNVTASNTLEWSGWNHPSVDTTDRYTFDVPANHGYEVCVSHDGQQYGISGLGTVLMIMDLFGSPSNLLPANTYVYYGVNPICWSTNQSTGYFGGEANMIGVRNWFASSYPSSVGEDYDVIVSFFTLDADGDGWYDDMELSCGTDPYDNSSVPQDTDADGICDALDSDTDGDGVIDSNDDFPLDPNEWSDLDLDGTGDNSDLDLDGDGWNNTDEDACLTDPLDGLSFPADWDNDTICDYVDPDDDNDGYDDENDAFQFDSTEWADNDGDEIGDNADTDDDNDGYDDAIEIICLSDPMDVASIPTDQDLDGICDASDNDLDGDGYDNAIDVWPEDPTEWSDFDGDGFGDNIDTDDDNDIVLDVNDAFPYDASEWVDTDGDGVGDNSDLNDDGDAWSDADEQDCGTDPLDADSVPDDYDGDGICDKVDTDNDGDGVPDISDAFPYDATESTDNDFDGVGDLSDTDDDNDGWLDTEEPNCATDPMDPFSVPADLDGDRQCDLVDSDDDNDGTLDTDDDFPRDPNEQNDLDGDGIGDNTDNDDDGDGWLDVTELICLRGLDGVANTADDGYGDPNSASVTPVDNESTESLQGGPDGLCNSIDPDDDGDGYPDPLDPDDIQPHEDAFKWDHTEWHDANDDGSGDNGVPLTFMDNVQADPQPFAIAVLALLGVILIVRRAMGGSDEEDEFDDYDETEQFLDGDDFEEAIDEAFDEEDED